jgi:hypothetical protein
MRRLDLALGLERCTDDGIKIRINPSVGERWMINFY